MNYSRWATIEELKEKLNKITPISKIERSGIPMLMEGKNLYIKDDEAHTMVIGATGSGKTQTTVLPVLRLAMDAEESFIVNDVNGELYGELKHDLEANNYNTVVINLANPSESDNFNPLSLPRKLYLEGKKDQAIDMLDSLGKYLFCSDTYNPNSDPFWVNSATALLVGLTIYEFENSNEEVTISKIANLVNDFENVESKFKELAKDSIVSKYLSSIVLAPEATKGSILAVFKQSIMLLATRESLNELMSKTSFEIENIQKDKTALFIISENKSYTRRLIPMIIEECYQGVRITSDKNRRLNFLLDEFESLIAINEFISMLTSARASNIRFNIYIKSFLELENIYGKETTELLKFNFSNIIYLLSLDYNTLEEISKMCGNQKVNDKFEPLITPEELKLLDQFEAIILMPRINPIRAKLIPDYKIDWK